MSRRAWCLSCGSLADVIRPSMDERHPIGECLRLPRSCGQVVVTYDQDEAMRIVDERAQARARARHAVHVRDGTRPRSCSACNAIYAHERHRAERRHVSTCPDCIAEASGVTAGPAHA